MIAVDTNVLVYAHRRELPQHDAARRRLTELAEGSSRWAIPVFCLGEFLRVITHPRVFEPSYTIDEGCEALRRVLAAPSLAVLYPRERYAALLLETMKSGGAAGNLVFDAQIAALCLESGATTLLTNDRGFRRFPGLTIEALGD